MSYADRRKAGRYRKPKRHFVLLDHWLYESPAWVALSASAKAIYVMLKSRYDGTNNGRLALSAREAGTWLSAKDGKSKAARAILELTNKGFVKVEEPSSFNTNGRKAQRYSLTEVTNDVTGELATKEFMRWHPEKESVVPPAGRSVPPAGRNDRERAANVA